jgi:2-keto-4-pentenoate hydratase/2-oxohepta-3-ene-1,7-dioic acid hydratase in catechol pathway
MFAKQNGVAASPIPDVWYKQPIYYKANCFAIRGYEEDVHWAKYSKLMVYELELPCVIGKTGKDFDGANILGPYIVTKVEIGDVYNLKTEARVNGERWGGGNSGSMHHKWDAVLANISDSETLYAGEIIGSGTVGTGCGLELGKFHKDGDVVELEIEKIGVLRNKVFAS